MDISRMSSRNFIDVTFDVNFDPLLQDNRGAEPSFILSLKYVVVGADRETIHSTVVRSRHRLADCRQSYLKEVVKQNETFPLETIMRDEHADRMREGISSNVEQLVRDNIGLPGIQNPHVNVMIMIYPEQLRSEMRRVPPKEYDAGAIADMRMALVTKNVYMGAPEANCGGGRGNADEKEACVICLEAMAKGAVVVCTPCQHHFHVECIRRWFEKARSCPLCRFVIDQDLPAIIRRRMESNQIYKYFTWQQLQLHILLCTKKGQLCTVSWNSMIQG